MRVAVLLLGLAALTTSGCEKEGSGAEPSAQGAARQAPSTGAPVEGKPKVQADSSIELRVLGMT